MDRREFFQSCGVLLAVAFGRLLPVKKKRQFDEITDIGMLDDALYLMGYEDGICWIVKSDTDGSIYYEVCQFALDSRPTCMALMGNKWFIGCDNGDMWSSEDAGQTWGLEQYEICGGMDAVAWAGGDDGAECG